MITFIILTLIIGIINIIGLWQIDKTEKTVRDPKTGEFISIFSLKTPAPMKIFIALQFVPFINITFLVLLIVDLCTGKFK